MATCCCASSSHGLLLRSLLTSSSSSSSSIRLIWPSAPCCPRLSSSPSSRTPPKAARLYSSSQDDDEPPLGVAGDEEEAEDQDDRIGFQIQVSKIGKRNRRLVRARVRVDAPLEAVWATLTDYEGLADFIPGLSECRLLDQAQGFARLYQVGEQDLALGFKFNAKGTIDCYEGDLETAPSMRRREIAFNMIDGDFKVFQGKWSVQESIEQGQEGGEGQEFQTTTTTTLSYLVELEPKLWVPVRLLEGRICSEIKNNLVSIREQARRRIIPTPPYNVSDH